MAVKRIVPNIGAGRIDEAKGFYGDVLGLELVMDLGWIVTLAGGEPAQPQISVLSEGGSGMPVPDISVEVDDLEEIYARVLAANVPVEYGPAVEPWGVQRFFVRDPFGKLVNILTHHPVRDAGDPKE